MSGASSTTLPTGRVTRAISPRTARSQAAMSSCTEYCWPKGRFDTQAPTLASGRSSLRASPSPTSASRAFCRAACTAWGSISSPFAFQPAANASRRTVPDPQHGSSNTPCAAPARRTIALATVGRSAPSRSHRPAVMLAHSRIGEPQPSNETPQHILDDPDLDLRGVTSPPRGPVPLDRLRQLPAQLRTQEGTLLEDSYDHPEAHRPAERPYLLSPHGQRPLHALRSPDPPADPAGSVALGPQRPTDLDEDVLGQPQVEDLPSTIARSLEDDHV